MARPKIELADIIKKYGEEYRSSHSLTKKQKSVLTAIEYCRTDMLGCHLDQCTKCNYREISYNSCRDRHCPKCQGIAQRQWVEKRVNQILPVPYYHVVFTLPATLFPFSLYNKRLVYNLLFDSAAATLTQFGKDPGWLGGKIGFFGILHTWGQTLWHHPHVHFIVAGGAIKDDGTWIEAKHKGKFLFPVRALSKVFRGIFMGGLEKALKRSNYVLPVERSPYWEAWTPEKFLKTMVARKWIVYCKSPFKKAAHVIRYIGRYTHRVALSNSRLLSMENGRVQFSYKDYREKGNRKKKMVLTATEFLQRFLWHVLPQKFHRIRHYGFLANGTAEKSCRKIMELLGGSSLEKGKEEKIKITCPACGKGFMVMIKLLTQSNFLIEFESTSCLSGSP